MNLILVRYLLPKGTYIGSLTGYICVDVMGQVAWWVRAHAKGETSGRDMSVSERDERYKGSLAPPADITVNRARYRTK